MCPKIVIIFLLQVSFLLPASAQPDSAAYSREPLRFTGKQCIAPLLFLSSGLVVKGSISRSIVELRNEHIPHFHTSADDVFALAPIAIAYGLDLAGVHSRTDFYNRSAILIKGEIMLLGSVYALKNVTQVQRPDGSDNHSFPSSHTAQAFLAATFLSQEYKDEFCWMPYASYTLAASVGVLRLANNRHHFSDVLFGAGLGILSQKIAYWTHGYRWGKRSAQPILQF